MKYGSVSKYYIFSIISLFRQTSFWKIPLILIKKPVVYTLYNGYSFYVDRLMDIWVLKELLLDKQYSFYGKPDKNWIVIDIGVGIGEFAIYLSPLVKQIYGYDPDDNRIKLAKKNILLHKSENISLYQKAAGNLESLFLKHGMKKCNLLKIDWEGCEYPILLNSTRKTLKKIERIIMEVHLFTPEMKTKYTLLKKHLRKSGFALTERKNPVHSYLGFLYAERRMR